MIEKQSPFTPAAGSGAEKAFWKLARNAEGGDPVAMQQLGLWLLRLSMSENQLPPGVAKEGYRWVFRSLRQPAVPGEEKNRKTAAAGPIKSVPGKSRRAQNQRHKTGFES